MIYTASLAPRLALTSENTRSLLSMKYATKSRSHNRFVITITTPEDLKITNGVLGKVLGLLVDHGVKLFTRPRGRQEGNSP